MNARFFTTVRIGLTVTALTLCGALALTTSGGCASSNDSNGGTSGGGSSGSGGSAGGGSSGGTQPAGNCGTPATGNATNFCNGRAQGTFTGWGWVALGSLDTLTDPTCGTDKTAIDNAHACTTTTNWTGADALCITGSIPALPATPVQSDYDNNWGVQVGVSSSEPTGTTIAPTATNKVVFTVTGTPTAGLRAMLHRKGDPDGTTYCANMVSGTAITLTSFNTKCWDGSGTDLKTADISNIDKAGVQVSSTGTAITVTNLCLKSIEFQ